MRLSSRAEEKGLLTGTPPLVLIPAPHRTTTFLDFANASVMVASDFETDCGSAGFFELVKQESIEWEAIAEEERVGRVGGRGEKKWVGQSRQKNNKPIYGASHASNGLFIRF